MIVATSSSQAIARLLFRPSLRDTFGASSRSINSLPFLMLGMQKMKRNWTPLLPECRKMKRPKHQPFARLLHPEASSAITSAPLATFTTKGAPTEAITEKTFPRERRRLQAKHLWMELGSHVRKYLSCCSTGLPGAAKGIPMKRKHTVDLPTVQSKHGGSNAKSGCCITNAKARHWSWTLKAFCMRSGARKRMLVLRLMHIWNIAQRGGKQERALTSSSDDDWARVVSPYLRVFTGRVLCVLGLCCFCLFCLLFSVLLVKTPAFNSRFTFFCGFLVVDRPCPVLARQCRKNKKMDPSDTSKHTAELFLSEKV